MCCRSDAGAHPDPAPGPRAVLGSQRVRPSGALVIDLIPVPQWWPLRGWLAVRQCWASLLVGGSVEVRPLHDSIQDQT